MDIQNTPLLLGLCVILGRLHNPFVPPLPHLFGSWCKYSAENSTRHTVCFVQSPLLLQSSTKPNTRCNKKDSLGAERHQERVREGLPPRPLWFDSVWSLEGASPLKLEGHRDLENLGQLSTPDFSSSPTCLAPSWLPALG